MNVEETISGLANETAKALKKRLGNANRLLARDPAHEDAKRLRPAILDELTRRKMPDREPVGPLWWEPHDPDVPEFFAYEEEDSLTRVAAVFKRDTHTAARKYVYSVRIGAHKLPGWFAEVKKAREAGSEAWEQGQRP